ncbi:MAG TPA: VanZ family protein [Candidatus Dormibacteraeota bacterium]|nr:VanZ family protein [Candidatus Dormibacteraeota bacterium]
MLISIFSTHYFSSEQTARVIDPLLRWLFPHAMTRTFHLMHAAIRKFAHVIEFGAFSVSVFHGVRGPRHGWRWSWAVSTLFVAVAYAALDEWHQSFVPLREARVRDVATDALGALLAQTLVWIYSGLKKPHSAEAVTLRSHPPSLKE